MRVKLEEVAIPLPEFTGRGYAFRFVVRYKRHWWSRWRYLMDERCGVPELFTDEQIARALRGRNANEILELLTAEMV